MLFCSNAHRILTLQWSFCGPFVLGDVGVVGTLPDGIFFSMFMVSIVQFVRCSRRQFGRFAFTCKRNYYVPEHSSLVFRNQFVRSAFGLFAICSRFNWFSFVNRMFCPDSIVKMRLFRYRLSFVLEVIGNNGTKLNKWISEICFACDSS